MIETASQTTKVHLAADGAATYWPPGSSHGPARRLRVVSCVMTSRFKPGDHLKVQHPLRYMHHGIYINYINDDRVIQFGGGVLDKPNARIDAVLLEEFERHGPAQIVRHGRRTLLTGHLPEADAPWKIVARAEFLLKRLPALPERGCGGFRRPNCQIWVTRKSEAGFCDGG